MKMNMNEKRRDEIIFGEYNPDNYLGGIIRFHALTASQLEMLLNESFASYSEKHNSAPTIMEFYKFLRAHDGATCGGYVVSKDRPDYRVSLDSISIDIDGASKDDVIDFAVFSRLADEFYPDKGYAWFD